MLVATKASKKGKLSQRGEKVNQRCRREMKITSQNGFNTWSNMRPLFSSSFQLKKMPQRGLL
jgi:hypothetical protein